MFMPAIAVLGVVYSSIFPVNRMSAESGDPYIGYVFWFSLIASAALLGACALRRQMPPITLPHVRAYAILGIVGVALPVPLLTYVAPKVPVGIITLELALVPLLTYLISWLLRIERLRASGVVGLMFGLAGMLLVLVPDVGLPDPDMVGWAALALVAPLCFACANAFATVFRPPAASSLVMAAGLTTCATIMLAPVILASGPAYVFLLIECLAEAGVEAGLPRELSDRLALLTVAGSGQLALASDEPPGTLRENVTSPGGTTLEALTILMAGDGLQPLMTRAIAAATERSRELAG